MRHLFTFAPSLFISVATLATLSLGANGCASTPKSTEPTVEAENHAPPPPTESELLREQVAHLTSTVATLEKKLGEAEQKMGMMNDKINAANATQAIALKKQTGKIKTSPISVHPADAQGEAVEADTLADDPEAEYARDASIQKFRDAMVLFDGGKYAESVLQFSNFLQNQPDHVLAGAAQYHVGEAYFKQREFRLALDEYQRVIVSYDRSSYTPEALRRMAECEDQLNRPKVAARHRQQLLALFPQSPAAAGIRVDTPSAPAMAARPTQGVATPASEEVPAVEAAPVHLPGSTPETAPAPGSPTSQNLQLPSQSAAAHAVLDEGE
ncbi:MAG: tol-pal system YbgF family protein [Bacteriovoracia bacterium]